MSYEALKHSHSGLAYLTLMLFVLRFVLFYFVPTKRTNKALKILPHIIDTLLLVFAIMLCIRIGQYPFTDAWLTAKVIGLIAYIGFGVVAIRRAHLGAFAAAVLSFAYVLGVAKYKTILSWGALF